MALVKLLNLTALRAAYTYVHFAVLGDLLSCTLLFRLIWFISLPFSRVSTSHVHTCLSIVILSNWEINLFSYFPHFSTSGKANPKIAQRFGGKQYTICQLAYDYVMTLCHMFNHEAVDTKSRLTSPILYLLWIPWVI